MNLQPSPPVDIARDALNVAGFSMSPPLYHAPLTPAIARHQPPNTLISRQRENRAKKHLRFCMGVKC